MDADYAELRTKMVDGQLRTTDVTSAPLLQAMGAVPREMFVDAKRRPLAYIDEDIALVTGAASSGARYLMEPSPFAKLIQLAAIKPGDFVLDIGTGTGYSSAVLSRLASSVIALESDSSLAEQATATLAELGCDNVIVMQGALPDGYAPEAPYDVIVVNGAVEALPAALFDQMKEGGRLVAVEGHGNAGVARVHVKTNGVVTARPSFNAAVKPLPGFEKTRVFDF